RQVVLQTGRQLLNVHLDAALAGHTGDHRVRMVQLDAHGCRQAEAHGTETTGVDPAVGFVERIVLGRKHLMLTDVGGNVGVALGDLPEGLDHGLRLDDGTVAHVVGEQLAVTAPLVDLLPPGSQYLGPGLELGLAGHAQHFIQHAVHRPDNRNIRLDGLGDGRRVDIDMDDLGVRAELGRTVDHPVVEARADAHDHVCMVHGDVGGVAAMHAQHAEELAIGTRKATQTHQGIGDRDTQLLAQLCELLRSAAHDHATTGVDDRATGFDQQVQRLADLTGVAADRRVIGAQLDLLRVAVFELLGRVGHVLRDIDDHRTGATGLSEIEGLLDDFGDLARILDDEAVLHDRAGDADHVGLLEGIGADHVTGNLAGNDYHWYGVHVGRCDTGNGIGGAGTRGHQHHARLAGGTRVAISHVCGGLLMTHQHVGHIILTENRVIDVQQRTARVPVNKFNTLVTQ